MLRSLYIKNVAIISRLNLELEEGLNILSGETGAGKSIIIDSLNFVLGGKADKSLIRYGEEQMSVEALFTANENVRRALAELDFEEDEELVILRTLNVSGRSEIKLNGRPTTLSVLKSLTQYLCDIYGQSEHISLLKTANHLKLVDAYAGKGVEEEKETCAGLLSELRAVNAELASLGGNPEERARLLDLYAFQVREIEEANLGEHEEEELVNLRSVLAHAEKIAEGLKGAVNALSANEIGAAEGAGRALSELHSVLRYDGRLEEYLPRLESVKFELEDISDSLSGILEGMDFDESEADRVFERLDKIKSLKKKYGADYAEITAYCARTRTEYEKLKNADERISELNAEKARILKHLGGVCAALSALRRAAAKEFETRISAEFESLALKHARFQVEFSDAPDAESLEASVSAEGYDRVQFLFSANAGEPLKPLEKVISGGEMSRFMLAIKQITADLDDIGTQVFDEVDAGISGEASVEIAKKIAKIARHRQVISITHTAAIVAVADANFFVEKRVEGGKTLTGVVKLAEDGRVREVARLLGAVEKNEYGELHAKELLAWGEDYKRGIS